MKPLLLRHIETTTESFKAWKNASPYLHNPWHYHPEFEITAIIKGKGVLFVGDKILNYSENELFLIGSNLPHEWRSDFKHDADFYSQSIAVHFKKNFPGIDFDILPEAIKIKKLFEQSFRGIKIRENNIIEFVMEKMHLLIETEGIERISLLFTILNALASTPNLEILSSPSFVNSIDAGENHKIIEAYKYMIANFKDHISLDQVAKQLNMTATSFCRFFKKRTNKSFIQYLNEIRVGYSCKLLIEDYYNISEVAYESGFENISHFNKQFKKIMKLTPKEFTALQSTKSGSVI
ncbi:MAG: AraC family transcriptional regulator [Bacteroidetes bacterium]|nr:AraC family transcriptional regulator [Bacteroidota bacterium]MBS1929969.1 AraC family transcriptional regulator [Bacteroidota bacterium]